MPPHKEPQRAVRNEPPDFTEFMEESISHELLETVRKSCADVKDEENELLSLIGSYESEAEIKTDPPAK